MRPRRFKELTPEQKKERAKRKKVIKIIVIISLILTAFLFFVSLRG